MESLMKKDLVEVINRQRSGTLAEYTAEPNVITEDIEDKVFDIVDGKGTTVTIKRNAGKVRPHILTGMSSMSTSCVSSVMRIT